MKKHKLMLIIVPFLLCACSGNSEDKIVSTEIETTKIVVENPRDDYEDILPASVDRITFCEMDRLIEKSDYVIVGEILDTEQELIYEYDSTFNKNVIVDARTTAKIKVNKALKGDLNEDGIIQLIQEYGYDDENKKLIRYCNTTPMKIGDKWLFCLGQDDSGMCWLAGDHSGRYPLIESFDAETAELIREYSKTKDNNIPEGVSFEQFGLYESNDISLEIHLEMYSSILEKYGL